MAFDISAHPLLSTAVSELEAEQLTAWTRIAEHALGVAGQEFGSGTEDVEHALAITVNAFVEHDGRVVQAESKGSQSVTYAKIASGLAGLVPPLARAILDGLRGTPRPGSSVTVTSFAW